MAKASGFPHGDLMKEKHQCAGMTQTSGAWATSTSSRCVRNGTLEHDGKWWCKQHHPPSVKERIAVKHAGWEAKWAARDKAKLEAKAELERRSRAYDAALSIICHGVSDTYLPYLPSAIKRILETTK